MKYEDIIDMPHHQSDKHPKMSMRNRAAQFSPFAALNGYNEAIKEASLALKYSNNNSKYIDLYNSIKKNRSFRNGSFFVNRKYQPKP